jgi:hypothetical protein
MRTRSTTIVLASLTLIVLVVSAPDSLREAYQRGGFYLFSRDFITDIPKRLSGPGWFRFILQPSIAVILGIRNGIADARAGHPPYLWGIIFHRETRGALVASGFGVIVNLVLMGILLDSIFQWFILGISYPGAAVLIGPTLIAGPYAVARAWANRWARPHSPG